MHLRIGVGVRTFLQDSYKAGAEAARDAADRAGEARHKIAVVFASSHYGQTDMLRGINDILKGVPVIGCSSAGAISNDGVKEDSIAVLILGSDTGSFYPVKTENISANMRAAGVAFAEALKAAGGADLKGGLIFSDALSGNGTELVRGVLHGMRKDFPLAGAAAGDDMAFKKTFQYYNNEVLNDAAVGFGVSGEVSFLSAAGHGWHPIGVPRTVTKAKGTTLIELDGKPAFSIYQDYFEEQANDFKQALSLPAVTYPLGMRTHGIENWMIRVPLVVNPDGSIVCGAEVIEGSEMRLMIGTPESSLTAAEQTAKTVSPDTSAEPRVAFIFDCVARKILFGNRKEEEIAALRAVLGPNTELFGFYSYGQIAPLRPPADDINTCDPGFYEQSVSLTVVGN